MAISRHCRSINSNSMATRRFTDAVPGESRRTFRVVMVLFLRVFVVKL